MDIPPLSSAQVSLLHVPNLPDHSVPNHLVSPWRRFVTLRASAQRARLPCSFSAFLSGLLPSRVWASPVPSRLAESTRPKRVRYPTDWSFTSCCSTPRLTATQLQSVTGCSVGLERTCTSLIEYARRRTRAARGRRLAHLIEPCQDFWQALQYEEAGEDLVAGLYGHQRFGPFQMEPGVTS